MTVELLSVVDALILCLQIYIVSISIKRPYIVQTCFIDPFFLRFSASVPCIYNAVYGYRQKLRLNIVQSFDCTYFWKCSTLETELLESHEAMLISFANMYKLQLDLPLEMTSSFSVSSSHGLLMVCFRGVLFFLLRFTGEGDTTGLCRSVLCFRASPFWTTSSSATMFPWTSFFHTAWRARRRCSAVWSCRR